MNNTFHRLLKVAGVAAVVALLALAWAGQGIPPAQAILNDTDGDTVIDVAEVVTGSDPNNPNSTPESTEAVFASGFPLCSDDRDNDLDGLTDGADNGCADSDGDIISDATETFLQSDPNDAASFPEDSRLDAAAASAGIPLFLCADGRDNDGDGLIDGDDPPCTPIRNDGDEFDDLTEKRFGSDPANAASVPEHEIPNPGSCTDGVDNDLDGLTDGADPACRLPQNDDFADASVIAGLPFTDSLKITAATSELGEARSSCAFGGLSATVWYSLTPAQDGVLLADTTGSDFDTVVAVWTMRGDSLTEVDCRYRPAAQFSRPQSPLAFRAAAGQKYFFQVGGYFSPVSPANLTFHLEAGIPPANDDFQQATTIAALPFAAAVDTTAATRQVGEPSCLGDRATSTVWYKLVPDQDALLVADASDSDFPAVIGVWTESKFGLTAVACAFGYAGDRPASKVAFDVTAGQTLFFQVGGSSFDLSAGNLSFSLEVGVPPANDDFANATNITTLPFNASTETLTAGAEPGEPAPTCLYGGVPTASVWYRYTSAAHTFLLADTEGSGLFGISIGVYQGSSLADLTQVACAQPGYPDTELAFEATGGQTYYFQVGTQSFGPFFGKGLGEQSGFPFPPENAGLLVFNLDTLEVPSCPAEQFSAQDPAGDTTSFEGPPFGREQRGAAGVFPPPPGAIPEHDIVSVSGGSNARTACITVEFAGPVAPPGADSDRAIFANFDFDTDDDLHTGYPSGIEFSCPDPDPGIPGSGLGVDVNIGLYGGSGILIPIYGRFEPSEEEQYAIVLFDERSFTLVIPLDALGGDDRFGFALYAGPVFGPPSDCAPNAGFIHSPTPLAAGDVNCDGATNSIDGALILQLFAALIPSLPCEQLGDINGSGVVGPIDAQLIMQYDARLLTELPAPPPAPAPPRG